MKAWFAPHRAALARALRRFAQAPWSSLLAALVIGIALALPASGHLLLANLLPIAERVSARPEISLFLALGADKRDAAEIQARLGRTAGVSGWRFVSREETAKRMRTTEGLAEVLDSLPRNPFPDAFVIEPSTETEAGLGALRETLAAWPKVEHVQIDSAWVKRLAALVKLARAALLAAAGLLAAALVVVTFNTIRLQILGQREEIELARLLGATDGFIRRPFFYFGTLQGLAGGAVACGLVFAVVGFARAPLADLAGLYDPAFSLRTLEARDAVLVLAAAGALGWLGAWASVSRHLRGG
ncbi:MAG: cell division protein FtsX [Rhodocyclales bacterium CG17_big_fil_post_rev_8_21_14_2_50_68_7]|nr:MAG: cell division protein FtsX [Rhodocyclales bacterium CG17_big_fil_post_rev_8_21_14_2_50_68_7]